ncbi:MAG: ATP-binding protein [Rhodanobacteraceae bacterium]
MVSIPVSGAGGLDAEAVRAQLQRILASDAFANSPILSRFLRYVVECCIDGQNTPPKEYTIGIEVLQRGETFDPAVDTIVRVHARRLRARLARYYENDGRVDPIRIAIPTGHYQVDVTPQTPLQEAPMEPRASSGLVASEPGPRRQRFRSNAIPAPRTPLVDRASEVGELQELLTDSGGPRLVTLTGAAGSGKTRLAIEAGLRCQEKLPGDVVFVPLGSVSDAQTLEMALLSALGVRTVDNTPPVEAICRHLHDIELAPQLILDNFEQLAKSAPLIGSLLDACALLKVLVTSRIALHLYGECEYPVTPLAVPARDSMAPKELAVVPAVELFVQRAAAAHPGFALTEANAAAVAHICRQFDGLPLGIELAAAQCRTLTPAQLLEHFPERLDVPATNVADVPDRQRTLRHAIEWSHELLGEPERTLFRRLTVFSSGFTLEAAEAVANVREDLGIDVSEGVHRLLDNNLLQLVSDSGERRYALLETIRDYGLEQLGASGDRDDTRKAHAAYFLVLAEEGLGRLDRKTRKQWLERCDLERDNFRAALEDQVERGNGQWALRLVRALYRYWERRGYLGEACSALLSVLKRFEPSTNAAMWAQLACCAGALEGRMGNQEAGQAHLERGLEVARQVGDKGVEIMALTSLAVSLGFLQRYEDAVALFEECLHSCEESGSQGETAAALSNLAVARLALGEHEKARDLMERALESFLKRKEWTAAAWCLNQLGDAAMVAGRDEEAKELYQRSAQRFLKLADFLGIARCWTDLGQLALQRGEFSEAASRFADALRIYRKQGFLSGVANLIEGCAALAVAKGRYTQALVLAGVAEAARSTLKIVAYPYQRARLDAALQPARDALMPVQISDCHQRGVALDTERAVGYVRQLLADIESDELPVQTGY